MRSTSFAPALAVLAGLLASTARAQTSFFQQCGTVEAGVTCQKLFRADDQSLWLLDDPLLAHQVGDRIRVRGLADPGCISICQQGNGCINGALILGCSPLGDSFCPQGIPNSTGQYAEVLATGSALVAANDLTLTASGLPPGSFAFFIASETPGIPATPGVPPQTLCLMGQIGRLHAQVGPADAAGVYAISTDPSFGAQSFSLAQFPTPTGFTSVQAGQTWHFQVWHRDVNPANPAWPTSDFTEALSIAFQ